MANSFIPYGKHSIDENDIKEVSRALKSNSITKGPYVRKFEKAFADYVGAKYVWFVQWNSSSFKLSFNWSKF